jgi:hypothetical protein
MRPAAVQRARRMSAAAHFLLLNWLVNKRIADAGLRCTRASDWIYIHLTDWQRSPTAYVRKNGPAPHSDFGHVTLRLTAHERSALLSGMTCSRGVNAGEAKALVGSTKLMLLCNASVMCSVAYFCCCNGKWVVSCCSCRHSCAWACKGSSTDHVCFRWILLVQDLC